MCNGELCTIINFMTFLLAKNAQECVLHFVNPQGQWYYCNLVSYVLPSSACQLKEDLKVRN